MSLSEVVIGTQTLDAMLAELSAAGRGVPTTEGVTVEELGAKSGWPAKRVRESLKRAIACGTWEHAGFRPTKRLDGRAGAAPVYRQVKRKPLTPPTTGTSARSARPNGR
jgi:hypothetical protein